MDNMYRIVVLTDPYHGSRKSGFKYSKDRDKMYKVLDEGMTLEEARKELLKRLKSKADNYPQYWDCETLEEAAKVKDDAFWVRDNGDTASFSYDTCRYIIENESNPFSIVVKEYSQEEIANKIQEIFDRGVCINSLCAYAAAGDLLLGYTVRIDDMHYNKAEFIEEFLENE